jgi:hypothetical protein
MHENQAGFFLPLPLGVGMYPAHAKLSAICAPTFRRMGKGTVVQTDMTDALGHHQWKKWDEQRDGGYFPGPL